MMLGSIAMADDDSLFEKVKKHIASKETSTGEDYAAANPKSSARGKYQFLKDSASTRVWEKKAGLKGPEDWVIEKDDDETERQRKAANQEKLFRAAYDRDYKNQYKKLQKLNPDLTPVQAMSLIHFQGLPGATKYAKTGQEPKDANNMSIQGYLTTDEKETMPKENKSISDRFSNAWGKLMGTKKDQEPASAQGMAAVRDRLSTEPPPAPTPQPTPTPAPPRKREEEEIAEKPPTKEEKGQQKANAINITDEETGEVSTTKVDDKLGELASAIEALPSGKLSSAEKLQYKDRIDQLRQLSDEAEGKIEMREMIESLAHAITQFAAAQYGLKHGVDMSGLKFDKRDWDKKIDRSIAKFRDRIKAVEQEQMAAEQGARQDRAEAVQNIGLKSQLEAAAERTRRAKEQDKLAKEAGARAERQTQVSEGRLELDKQKAAATKPPKDIRPLVVDKTDKELESLRNMKKKDRPAQIEYLKGFGIPEDKAKEWASKEGWWDDKELQEAQIRPYIMQYYTKQLGGTPAPAAAPTAPTASTQDKLKRLQELRAKAGQ